MALPLAQLTQGGTVEKVNLLTQEEVMLDDSQKSLVLSQEEEHADINSGLNVGKIKVHNEAGAYFMEADKWPKLEEAVPEQDLPSLVQQDRDEAAKAPVAPPPELISDAVAEILLCLPPSNPAGLVRASAACKPRLRTLSDPAFLRRYRAFHGTPLALGFLRNPEDRGLARFVPTSSFRTAAHDHRTCYVLDYRYVRTLMYDYGSMDFVIWDPITGRERRIRDEVPDVYTNHTVLCAAGVGCDHSGCSGGPFLLTSYVGLQGKTFVDAHACIYSSEADARSVESTYIHLDHRCDLKDQSAALVGGRAPLLR
ncbi:hypothetical protein C2845_PM01G42060 [Panicum miliaceum]|uniref:F-box domain-containing protein n=1 Tax=Panicum miliaceum TaxID=4540 RepID=A0A3L6TJ56_PANMI|nr:hypothetical protein C2845_PM01G42060 [Panicum miliaceum]